MDHLEIAKQFAKTLDANAFSKALDFLDPQCIYETGNEIIKGREKIIASYKANFDWASTSMDELMFESQVEANGKDFLATYADKISHRGLKHTYRCQQRLSFSEQSLISKISHLEIPGEKERLQAFESKVGIVRPNAHTNKSDLETRLCSIITLSPHLVKALAIAEQVNLPHWYIGAGCVTQTVWNHLSDFPINQGIKDVDLIYYDPTDLSEDAERAAEEKVKSLLPDFPLNIDVNNQARVHLWYEKYFGYPIEAYTSVEGAIDTWPTTATAIAVRKVGSQHLIYAPFGLTDLFAMTARANKRQITQEIYETKIKRWLQHWPSLHVIPWEAMFFGNT